MLNTDHVTALLWKRKLVPIAPEPGCIFDGRWSRLLYSLNLGIIALFLPFAGAFADAPSSAPSAPSGPLPGGSQPATILIPTGDTAIPADPYTNLKWKGINVNFPPPSNTIDPTLFGLRKTLGDLGIGWTSISQNTAYDNLLHGAKTTNGNQLYIGQKPTAISNSLFVMTYDLSQYGIPDGQIAAGVDYLSTTWEPLGPNNIGLGTLTYYQTLFNKQIEIKAGLIANSVEFAGPYVAGSLSAGVFGPSGSLFTQSGLSSFPDATYGINVTGHFKKYFYDKIGVSRAISPDGVVYEHNHDRVGVTFSTPNTGAYVINELGYLRLAKLGEPQTWVRVGGAFSGSRFRDFDNPGRRAEGNYVAYLLADRQIWQSSHRPAEAYRGLYVGFSVEYSPSNLSRFSQYYEGRVYGLGILPNRKHDQISGVFTDTYFSRILTEQAFRAGQPAHHDSKSFTLSYSAYILHGLYANFGLSYVNNPTSVTYTSRTGSALNAILGFSVFF